MTNATQNKATSAHEASLPRALCQARFVSRRSLALGFVGHGAILLITSTTNAL